jgi:ribosomal protein S18 acetylase RimI-like enzyme
MRVYAISTVLAGRWRDGPGATGREEVTGDGRGNRGRAEATKSTVLGRDARILRRALLKAVRTSPDSFMTTIEDVQGRPHEYWINEIRFSTWVVAQRRKLWWKQIVGVVAGRRPDAAVDREDQAFTRYIGSVWIAPKFRHRGLGTRLIHYLLEMEYRKNRQIRQFLLWVFAGNSPAIKMYEHMGFLPTRESKPLERGGHSTDEVEVKYCLDFDAAVHTADEDARRLDRRLYRVTYRVLGEQ